MVENNNKLPQSGSSSQIDSSYTLRSLMSKIHRTEVMTFGNYFIDCNEFFKNESEYKDYLKNKVSLFNNDNVNKPEFKGETKCNVLTKNLFHKFSDETLFYMFYFMTRDILQLYAAQELYKKGWKYHIEYQIWFHETDTEGSHYTYFNPLDWKTNQYIYGSINQDMFLDKNEVEKLVKNLNIDNHNN